MSTSKMTTPRVAPMQLRTPKQAPIIAGLDENRKKFALESVSIPPAAVRIDKAATPTRSEVKPVYSRGPTVLGGIAGGILTLLFIMTAVHPPRHDVAESNSKLRAEVTRRERQNQVLQSLIDELKRRERERSREDTVLIKLEELEGKLQRSELHFQPELHAQALGGFPHPGDVVRAAHDFSFGGTLVIRKDSPGVIIREADYKGRSWVVEFVGIYGATRPIGITAKRDDLHLA